jgi:hypothetical protein
MSDPTTAPATPAPVTPPKPAINPAAYIPTLTSDGKSVTIPLASLGLAPADFDPATGDARKLIMALLGAIAAKHAALPSAQRPKTFIVRGGSTGPSAQYTVIFKQKIVTPATFALASE